MLALLSAKVDVYRWKCDVVCSLGMQLLATNATVTSPYDH